MQAKTLITSIALAAACTAAFAQEATSDAWRDIGTSRARADVVADVARARAQGQLAVTELGYNEMTSGARTRVEVLADLHAARASGELAALNGEVYAFTPRRTLMARAPH